MAFSIEQDKVPEVAARYGWSNEVAETKIRKTQQLLQLMHPIDAIEFLLGTLSKPLICDGCNVRGVWEHRCHRNRSVVQGEQTGKKCQCPDCFVVNELGIS